MLIFSFSISQSFLFLRLFWSCCLVYLYIVLFRESCREKSCSKSRVLCILWPANASGNVWESFIRTCP